jgi:hypothetical protein
MDRLQLQMNRCVEIESTKAFDHTEILFSLSTDFSNGTKDRLTLDRTIDFANTE